MLMVSILVIIIIILNHINSNCYFFSLLHSRADSSKLLRCELALYSRILHYSRMYEGMLPELRVHLKSRTSTCCGALRGFSKGLAFWLFTIFANLTLPVRCDLESWIAVRQTFLSISANSDLEHDADIARTAWMHAEWRSTSDQSALSGNAHLNSWVLPPREVLKSLIVVDYSWHKLVRAREP